MAGGAPGAASASGRLRRRLPLLALLLAAAAVVLLAIGPVGWHLGWWHFRIAFFWLMPWAGYCGLAAMAVAALAVLFGRRPLSGWRIALAALALVIGAGIAYVPWHYDQRRGSVPNDITTDLENPPAYAAVLTQRKADNSPNSGEYKTAKAEQQRKNYPDIAPVTLDLPPAAAFDRALAVAKQMGWTIAAADPEAGRIEASEKSRWFGFIDDIVIRVVAAGNGSRIDVRSSSRVGTGDFGVNAARVRKYLAALREAAHG
jgi:uncharacterized protein (DUF1499 family)